MATTLADKIRRPSLKHFPGDSLVGAITDRMGAMPDPRRMLEVGQWATPQPLLA